MDSYIDEDDMLFLLNTLGQTYNFSSKFEADNKIVADMRDVRFIEFMEECLDKGYMIKNHRNHNLYDSSKVKDNNGLYFDPRFLKEKSKTKTAYDLVVLRYPHSNKHDKQYPAIVLSSLSKWDNIDIEDILNETSKMTNDKNKVVVDFKYNKRNKFRKVDKVGHHSIILEPGLTI